MKSSVQMSILIVCSLIASLSVDAMSHYTIHDDTVIDNFTGIVWQRQVMNQVKSFRNAQKNCATLKIEGESDWRLPTIKELSSLTDAGKNPIVDTDKFLDMILSPFWSNSKSDRENLVWVINFTDGSLYTQRLDESFRSLCAR